MPIFEVPLSGPLEPTNEWYAIAKIAGIQLCRALRIQHGFDALSLMPTNLYGPGDNYHPTQSHVMAALIMRFSEAVKKGAKEVICWGSGSPRREFLHVNDLASAAVHCLENWRIQAPSCGQDIMNVGTGSDISIKDLAELIAMETGFKGEIIWDHSKPDGTPRKVLNVERLANLGWKASIGLQDGLKYVIEDFRKNGI